MFRTEKTVGMLRAIAMIASLAILLWSLGLPSLRFADAANLTSVSDTLSDSAPSMGSNHTIAFTSPVSSTGVANTEDIVITFPGTFDLTGIGEEDIDILVDGDNKPVAEWSLVNGGSDLTITIDTGEIAAGSSTEILIGTHAVNEGSPDTDISNPGAEGSYEISISAGQDDKGSTRVVVIDSVTVSASVDTIFNFAVSGTDIGTDINGVTSNIQSTTTTIPFGQLKAGAATTTAQLLSVSTNASNGYVVTVQVDGPLQSSTGADIDYFVDGSGTDTPVAWASPSETVGDEATYGHWGVTSDDTDTTREVADEFGSNEFVSLDTQGRVVMSHNGSTNGTGVGVGTTTVGYRAEISALQEAGNDYTATLTYVATPTF